MFHTTTLNNRINRIHEIALRVAYKDDKSSFADLLIKDNSFTIHERNLQRLAIEMYKSKNGIAPIIMKEVFTESENVANLRNTLEFQRHNVKSVFKGTETISFRGPQIWSLVPESTKQSQTLAEFKIKIKNWKPEGCMCRLCKTFIPQLGFI